VNIVYDRNPKIHLGFVHGLKQASVISKLTINFGTQPDNNLTTLLVNFVFGKLNINQRYLTVETHDFFEIVARIVIKIQRNIKLPIYNQYQVLGTSSSSEAIHGDLLMPVLNGTAYRISLDWTVNLLNLILQGNNLEDFQSNTFEKSLIKVIDQLNEIYKTGQNYFYLVNACFQLNLPVTSFDQSGLKVGTGQRAETFNSTVTSRTSSIGIKLAGDKLKTKNLLRTAGMPAAVNYLTKDIHHALQLAEKIGYPLVIKPMDRDGGYGVYADIRDPVTLQSCYEAARAFSKNIMIEKHCEGVSYRFTLLHHEIIKLTQKSPLGIVGDGVSNINQLIQQLQKKLAKQAAKFLSNTVLDKEALGLIDQFGFSLESVLAKDYFLPLRRKSNASANGHTKRIDIHQSHPDNLNLVRRVSQLFDLDIAGIDLIIPAVESSWLTTPCIICDVNAMPQTDPKSLKKILKSSIQNSGRIPTFLMLCPKSQLQLQINGLKAAADQLRCNGFSSKHGLFINGLQVSRRMPSGYHAALALMQDKSLNRGLFLLEYDDVLDYGLPLEYFSSIRVIKPDHHALEDLEKLQSMINLLNGHASNIKVI
jgi:cyanophycin synthetase